MTIITYNDQEKFPLLEVESKTCIFPLNSTDVSVIKEMDETLDSLADQAIGLAAVQIGYPKRIFMLRGLDGTPSNSVFINPEIIAMGKPTKRDSEACLSLPGMTAFIKRPKTISIRFQDLDGNTKQDIFQGIWARAICHEIGHLHGKLISHEMQKEADNQSKRTKFGMVLSKHRLKVISARRAKKHAKK